MAKEADLNGVPVTETYLAELDVLCDCGHKLGSHQLDIPNACCACFCKKFHAAKP